MNNAVAPQASRLKYGRRAALLLLTTLSLASAVYALRWRHSEYNFIAEQTVIVVALFAVWFTELQVLKRLDRKRRAKELAAQETERLRALAWFTDPSATAWKGDDFSAALD